MGAQAEPRFGALVPAMNQIYHGAPSHENEKIMKRFLRSHVRLPIDRRKQRGLNGPDHLVRSTGDSLRQYSISRRIFLSCRRGDELPRYAIPGWTIFGPDGGLKRRGFAATSTASTSGGVPVKPIRIHLGAMPTMLRAIIEDLLTSEPGLVVVGTTIAGEDPLIQAREEQADMLITADASQDGGGCLRAIMSGPPLTILAIARDGRDATAISLVRQPVDFAGDGKSAFADAVRRVAGAH